MSESILLDKTYDPRQVEPEVYAKWEQSGAFSSKPDGAPPERTYTIVIPPPNVTGALHLGHALNNTLQDILIRYHRMRGFNTLWQPGTDHAGIATQAVVERRLREQEGKTRHELGREELVRRIWQWKDQYEQRIVSQLKLMGCSCDWERNRFTLDDGLARAVRQQFFHMFQDGLIFRGKRLVNWDTQLQTAVADDEVYHESVKGHFWHFRYPVVDAQPGEPEFVVIATTRPETMLGDTAVAVHPDPEGYFDREEARLGELMEKAGDREQAELTRKRDALRERQSSHLEHLVKLRDMARDGRQLRLPLVEREIPLVMDEWANPSMGSGCVKITPAHDPNDYEVGLRHALPMINVLTPDGKIARILESDGGVNPHSERYEGLTFTGDGRNRVVADLEERGLLDSVEDREHDIGHSDRSKLPIEPFLSDQWFVRTGDGDDPIRLGDQREASGLAQAAMDVVQNGDIAVFPPRYGKSYLDWLGEKRDWCISRQLWWGHRIPIWQFDQTSAGNKQPNLESVLEQLASERLIAKQTFDSQSGSASGDHEDQLICLRDDVPADLIARMESAGFVQDPDVLDTWFSSALWPFSTLGWPEQTDHLKQYYPTSVLCTSRDIITNWVARMVMFGLYSIGRIPFRHVYIHPKILDGRGETMSKSKGNGVDPVDIIHTHGADALRYSMADMCTETQDIRMPVEYICPHCGKLTDQAIALKNEEQSRKSRGIKLDRKLQPADCSRVKCVNKDCAWEFATQWADDETKKELNVARETSDKFEIGRNFCNKLWNAARFALMNLEGAACARLDVKSLPPEDRWILAQLSQTIRNYHAFLDNYQFSASIKELRVFFWESLCDWYIELTKPRMQASATDETGATVRQVLAFCMDQILRLLHPTVPFITERLWEQLNAVAPERGLPGVADLTTEGMLISAAFPPVDGYPGIDDVEILDTFSQLQDATRGVRDLRTQCNVPPRNKVMVTVVLPEAHRKSFGNHAHILEHMAAVGGLSIVSEGKRPANAGSVTIGTMRIFVHDVSDDQAERRRVKVALEQINKQIAGKEGKLGNAKFVQNAKPEIVEAERTRLAEFQAERETLERQMRELDE